MTKIEKFVKFLYFHTICKATVEKDVNWQNLILD